MKYNFFKVKDCAVVFNGKTPSKKEQRQDGKPILKIKDIDDNGLFLNAISSFVDRNFYKKYGNKVLKQGDSLILNAAHSSKYVGSKTHHVNNKFLEGVIPTGEWLIISKRQSNPPGVKLTVRIK